MKLTKMERGYVLSIFYCLVLSIVSVIAIANNTSSTMSIVALVFSLFATGWLLKGLDVEHFKSKNPAATEAKKPSPEDEEYWRKLLTKRGPLE